jgi:hypothetical protein
MRRNALDTARLPGRLARRNSDDDAFAIQVDRGGTRATHDGN